METIGELLERIAAEGGEVADAALRIRAKIELGEGAVTLDDVAPPTPPPGPAPGPGTGGGGG